MTNKIFLKTKLTERLLHMTSIFFVFNTTLCV